MSFSEYCDYDGLGLAELIEKHELTAAELVEAAIACIEAVNPSLNAVAYEGFNDARAMAAEPLADSLFKGVPFALKDLGGNHAGWPTTAGSRILGDARADRDDSLTQRFKKAGLIPLCKTTVPEFGPHPTTETIRYGATRSPWNLDHTPGGSSGGSAALVASGALPLAHANDGGGSIRMPASCSGLVGLKPSRGRVPLDPRDGVVSVFSVDLVVSKTVRDTAASLDAAATWQPGLPFCNPLPTTKYLDAITVLPPRLKIAYATEGEPMDVTLDVEVRKALEHAVDILEDLGHELTPTVPPLNWGEIRSAFPVAFYAPLVPALENASRVFERPLTPEYLEPLTLALYEYARSFSLPEYLDGMQAIARAAADVHDWHKSYRVWVTPVLGEAPWHIGEIDIHGGDLDARERKLARYMPYTGLQNATGQPAICVPIHWTDDGLPIGVQLVAQVGDEAILLQLAAEIERFFPWSHCRPPLWAADIVTGSAP